MDNSGEQHDVAVAEGSLNGGGLDQGIAVISDDEARGNSSEDADGGAGIAGNAAVRVCRKCSTQSQIVGEFCPNCGARFTRRGIGRRRKIFIGLIAVVLLAAGGAAGIVLKINHDNQVRAEKHREALRAQKVALAAEVAQQAQQAQQAAQQAQQQVQIDERKAIVNALQNSVTQDAQKDVNNGILNGPSITKTVCTPVGGGNLQDTLADHTGNWSCLAINQTASDGTASGYGFSATINYDTGSYTWHLGN